MIVSLLIFLVRGYKAVLSPILPFNQCRFIPTCSEYAVQALQKHGAVKGSLLAGRRILRCNPYSRTFGYDPVP